MIAPEHAVVAALLLCGTGAAATLLLPRRKSAAGPLAFGVLALSAVCVLTGAIHVLRHGPGEAVTLLALRPMGFALRLYVDGLSAVFLSLVAVVSLLCGLYSIEYMRHHKEHGAGRYYPNLLLFVAGMYGLVCTTDMMWFFFVFWQVMTWTGWALIRHERRRPENTRAALKYLWLMQIACGATMAGAAILVQPAPGGVPPESLLEYDFDTVQGHLPQLLQAHPAAVALAFGLFLIGFGIKMGMWPFGQYWLPDAHPAAPSPVSALLSGVMIKTGVYGLMRYFIWLVPADARADFPLAAWGGLLATLGVLTLVTGTAQGLRQDQAKRLLAYSTIGQAGYILLGVGVALTWLGTPGPESAFLATAAFAAALFHTINHALFKSLLFLNAGSVLHATQTQDLNKLGGLLRWMPLTACTALVASASIAGIPLSSGFASKWMLSATAIPHGALASFLPLLGAIAIFTSALTLALFLKFFGSIFLTRTSALVAECTRRGTRLEVPWTMRLPQVLLAALCIGLGLLPAAGFGLVTRALAASRQGLATLLADAPQPLAGWGGVGGLAQPAVYAPLLLAALMALLFLGIRAISRWGGAARRPAEPWLCGYAAEAEIFRYRARHWFGAVKGHFGWLGGRAPANTDTATQPAAQPVQAPAKKRLSWSLEKH